MAYYTSLYGITFMIINVIALSCLDIITKTLNQSLSPNIIVFLYKFTLFLIITPWIFSRGLFYLKTKKLHVHFFRSTFSVIGSIFFTTGLKYISIADAAALENIQYLVIVFAGMFIFKEKVTKTKILAALLGLIGAVLIVHPSLFFYDYTAEISFNQGYIYIFLAIFFWALNSLSVKILGNTESNQTQMFYLLFISSILSGYSALLTWSDVDILGYDLKIIPHTIDFANLNIQYEHLYLIGLMAALYFVHGVAYFNALKYELSIVIPFRYTKLIFSGLLSYLFFEDTHSTTSYFGYILVTISGLILVKYEIRRKRQQQFQLKRSTEV